MIRWLRIVYVAAIWMMVPACIACTPVTTFPATDIFGYVYPVECRRDLSEVKTKAVIVPASPEEMEKVRRARGTPGRLYGLTWGGKLIMIDNSLIGWMQEEILHHELCHVLTGQWHSEAPGIRR